MTAPTETIQMKADEMIKKHLQELTKKGPRNRPHVSSII